MPANANNPFQKIHSETNENVNTANKEIIEQRDNDRKSLLGLLGIGDTVYFADSLKEIHTTDPDFALHFLSKHKEMVAKTLIAEFNKGFEDFKKSLDWLNQIDPNFKENFLKSNKDEIEKGLINTFSKNPNRIKDYFRALTPEFRDDFFENRKDEIETALINAIANDTYNAKDFFKALTLDFRNNFLNDQKNQVEQALVNAIASDPYYANDFLLSLNSNFRDNFLESKKAEIEQALVVAVANEPSIIWSFEGILTTKFIEDFLKNKKTQIDQRKNSILTDSLSNNNFTNTLDFIYKDDPDFALHFLSKNREIIEKYLVAEGFRRLENLEKSLEIFKGKDPKFVSDFLENKKAEVEQVLAEAMANDLSSVMYFFDILPVEFKNGFIVDRKAEFIKNRKAEFEQALVNLMVSYPSSASHFLNELDPDSRIDFFKNRKDDIEQALAQAMTKDLNSVRWFLNAEAKEFRSEFLQNKKADIEQALAEAMDHDQHGVRNFLNELDPDSRIDFFKNRKDDIERALANAMNQDLLSSVNNLESATKFIGILNPESIKSFLKNKEKDINTAIVSGYQAKKYDLIDNDLFPILNQNNFNLNPEVKFIKELFGRHGGTAKPLLEGYFKCVDEGVVNSNDYNLLIDFTKKFKVIGPNIINKYKESIASASEESFFTKLKDISGKMVESKLSEEEKNLSYYKELLQNVYPNNAGEYGKYEDVSSCQDRLEDIENFNIDKVYKLETADSTKISLKQGQKINTEVLERTQKLILDLKPNSENSQENLTLKLNEYKARLKDSKIFKSTTLDAITDPKQVIFCTLISGIFEEKLTKSEMKDLLLNYWLSNNDLNEYVNGTSDRVSHSSNKDYALLRELNEFYADSIKEVNRELVTASEGSSEIGKSLEIAFAQHSLKTQSKKNIENVNKLQISKLGLTPDFIKQIKRILINRKLIKNSTEEYKQSLEGFYSDDKVKSVIKRYESLTNGLQAKKSDSENVETRAMYGKLKSLRDKTFKAAQTLGATDIDILSTSLDEINLQSYIDIESNLNAGKYDKAEFETYVAQQFSDIFIEEKTLIAEELAKYKTENGVKNKTINSYITKTAESAYARMVGGVCVSQDNPAINPKQNLWDMNNYFQQVLQDPDSLKCQGLVLLHHFTDSNGKKILTASFNPSSTFLYSTDERKVYSELQNTLIKFAEDNSFDIICVSKNKAIRTNRTGGDFEKAMDEQIDLIKKVHKKASEYNFSEPVPFSYSPQYSMQEMDCIWIKAQDTKES